MASRHPPHPKPEERTLRIFTAPWRPEQDSDSPYAKALKASLARDGQLQPSLILENGMVVDGRLRFKFMLELEKKPEVVVVPSIAVAMHAEIIKKAQTVLDQIRIIGLVDTGELGELPRPKRGEGKRSKMISQFVWEHFSWKWSPSKVEMALQISKLESEVLAKLEGARSIYAAKVMAGLAQRRVRSPSVSGEVVQESSVTTEASQDPACSGAADEKKWIEILRHVPESTRAPDDRVEAYAHHDDADVEVLGRLTLHLSYDVVLPERLRVALAALMHAWQARLDAIA